MTKNKQKDEGSQDEQVRSDVEKFLKRNFPQIQMHGGSSSIVDLDAEEGYVKIHLGGACSGCGISPMTTQAISSRLPNEVDKIDEVRVNTGSEGMDGMGFSDPSNRMDDEEDNNETEDDFPSAPF